MAIKSALLDEMATVIRRKGYSRNTSKTYRHWCEQFLLWGKRTRGAWTHPKELGRCGVESWLTDLAIRANVSPTSQNCALQSVLFLFREVLGISLDNIDALRSKRPQRLPTVLSPVEVAKLLNELKGQAKLIGQLLYGCGLRIGEAISLRIKDVDLLNGQITIRAAKGAKDRIVGIPKALTTPLQAQIDVVRAWHTFDVANGCNRVELPFSFDRKSPAAAGQLAWYWLFSSHVNSRNPEAGWLGRHHIDASNFGRSLSVAAKRVGILRRVHPHCLRHSYATHSLNAGTDIRSLQQLLGHNDVRTTMIYTHVEAAGVTSERSPLDRLPLVG